MTERQRVPSPETLLHARWSARRRCACGRSQAAGGECAECRGETREARSRAAEESRVGRDLSQVRLHTRDEAAEGTVSNQRRRAREGPGGAFGLGSGSGIFSPPRQSFGRAEIPGRRPSTTLPHREAMELAECLRIMGQENRAYCYEAVLGERISVPACPTVLPSGLPTVTRPAASNDCVPDPEVVNWDVISADANNWGVCVRSLTVSGEIKIRPWPSDPTHMVVPNTANPVDGGNINNTAGSNNHWQHAIDDMADYDTAGSGGAGPHWHSTAASEAHEWAHWNQDYLSDSVMGAAGGDWGTANADLNSLREPKATSPTVAAATAALRPRADARIATFIAAITARWNHLIGTTDSPGSGGRGYAAGAGVLSGLIAAVRAYKNSKGW